MVSGKPQHRIPQEDQARKDAPMYRGLLGYFPGALFEVARHSLVSDRKHNPGAIDGPHWARGKSSDHADCIVRHLIDQESEDPDEKLYHLTSIAWRGLALLQEELERRGSAPGASSVFPAPVVSKPDVPEVLPNPEGEDPRFIYPVTVDNLPNHLEPGDNGLRVNYMDCHRCTSRTEHEHECLIRIEYSRGTKRDPYVRGE